MPILMAALLFPGVLTALALGVILRVLLGRGAVLPQRLERNREALAALASIVLSGLGSALLPWPGHPLAAASAWLGAWALFELAFLLPLIPALLAGHPPVVRAAVREIQLGVAARGLLWVVLAAGLSDPLTWTPATLPLRLLILIAALGAFLPAIGWGPFGNEANSTPEGIAAGLPEPTQTLLAFAQDVRSAALLAAVLVATLPTQVGAPWLGIVQALAGFGVVALALRRLDGFFPRLTLRTALRLNWLLLAPLAAGVVLLAARQL